MVERPDWSGKTVVCIASGPSLTPSDCEKVRASGHPVIVTNTTYRLCPWADALFGFDSKWWKVHHEEVKAFEGRKFTASPLAVKYGAEMIGGMPWFSTYRNSGACAVSLAMGGRSKRIVLLGFDASFDKGKTHWHGDHPKGLENAGTIATWGWLFGILATRATAAGVDVVNASRRTALTCFRRADLEDVL